MLYFKKIILTLIYFLIGWLISLIIKKTLQLFIFGIKKTNNDRLLKKTQTLKTFINSAIYAVVFFVVIFFTLELWGINLMPFITGASILGLAISFGAQSLVKDLISGFFIILDNQFDVGDWIEVGKYQGQVKKISLRQTTLKDKNDNLIFIPNSQITTVLKINKKN